MKRNSNLLVAIGLGMGVVFGLLGSILTHPQVKFGFYEISSVGLTVGCVLLGIRYLHENRDWLSAGFFLFGIGEAVMSSGNALGDVGGQAAFGAGIALYVPAFLLISLPGHFPKLVRILGMLASIPFLIGSVYIFMGEAVYSSSPIMGAGYGLLSLTIIGWIVHLLRPAGQQVAGEEVLSAV